jgi:hypothetical protein
LPVVLLVAARLQGAPLPAARRLPSVNDNLQCLSARICPVCRLCAFLGEAYCQVWETNCLILSRKASGCSAHGQ